MQSTSSIIKASKEKAERKDKYLNIVIDLVEKMLERRLIHRACVVVNAEYQCRIPEWQNFGQKNGQILSLRKRC